MLDRGAALARLDGLARIARRDPLGIGPVAGYVAALEAGAIRLRAILAGLVGGWSRESVGSYLATGVGGGG
jgi:vacuolar-type H+-ATPase subunit C/Vma6